MSNIVITGKDLTLEQIALICRENVKIELAEEAKQNIMESPQDLVNSATL